MNKGNRFDPHAGKDSMKEKQKKMHYAWKIMIACIFLKLGTGGAITAITGNFVTPIVRDLGCQVSQFTMIVSIEAISMSFFYTIAAKILTTKRIGLVMGIASIAEVIGVALMATYSSVYMFYISGVILGVAQAFTGLVAVPILINMWFHKKAGTVLGIVIAVNGAATVGYGLLSAQLILSFGWRAAYLILAGMALIFTVPTVFLLVKSPAEVGCQPYGMEEDPPADGAVPESSPVWGLSRREAFRTPALYFAWIACLCYSIGSGVSGYVNTFATMEVGQSITFGAQAGMFLNIGWIACSIILGHINDRFGVKAGLLWGAVFTAIGYSTMIFGIRTPYLILPAALAVGLGNSMYQVQCPLLARTVVGERDYSSIWSIMMVANSLIGGGLYSSIGLIYDKTGSYYGAFVMAIALYIGALILGSIAVSAGQRLRAKSS